jgi:K+-transporting ATPase KdpF subunit
MRCSFWGRWPSSAQALDFLRSAIALERHLIMDTLIWVGGALALGLLGYLLFALLFPEKLS